MTVRESLLICYINLYSITSRFVRHGEKMFNTKIKGQQQQATQALVDHDSLLNYEAKEHYAWSEPIAGVTIHSSNIDTFNLTLYESLTLVDGSEKLVLMEDAGIHYLQLGQNAADTTAELKIVRMGTTGEDIDQFGVLADSSWFSGKVGIGSTGFDSVAPTYELDVNGTISGSTGIITNDFTVDGNTLRVDSANGRVGIGAHSPVTTLDVGGVLQVDAGGSVVTLNGSQQILSDGVALSVSSTALASYFSVNTLTPSVEINAPLTVDAISDFKNDVTVTGDVKISDSIICGTTGVLTASEKLRVRSEGNTWDGMASFGSVTADTAVIIGEYNTFATIGAHNSALTGWDTLYVNPFGDTHINNILVTESVLMGTSTTTLPAEKIRARSDGNLWDGVASFGSAAADSCVILGEYGGSATIGAHDNALSTWKTLYVNPIGDTVISSIKGTTAVIDDSVVIGTTGVASASESLRVRSEGNTWDGMSSFGSVTANAAVIVGEYNTFATIGGHNSALTGWRSLYVNPVGNTHINNLYVDTGLSVGTTGSASTLDVDGNLSVGASYGGAITAPTNGAIIEGSVGIGTATPQAGTALHIVDTTEQLRLGYDATNYTTFQTGIGGDLTIIPSGGDVNITGALSVSSVLSLSSQVIVDVTNAEAFLVRKDGDSGDVFNVNTSVAAVGVSGALGVTGATTLQGTLTTNDAATFNSTTTFNDTSTHESNVIIDVTNAEAFLVRKDGDSGDVFTVDTSGNGISTSDAKFTIDVSNNEAFLVRKNNDTGDVFTVDTSGGTGSVAVTGTFSVSSTSTFTGASTHDGGIIVDQTASEALLVRKNADGGDVFVVNTSGDSVAITGTLSVSSTLSLNGLGLAADKFLYASATTEEVNAASLSANFTFSGGTLDLTSFDGLSTTNLNEGTNLYYTDARVDSRVQSGSVTHYKLSGTPITGSNTAGIFPYILNDYRIGFDSNHNRSIGFGLIRNNVDFISSAAHGFAWSAGSLAANTYTEYVLWTTDGNYVWKGSGIFTDNIGDTPASTLDVKGNLCVGATYAGSTAAPANGAIVEGIVGIGTTSPQTALHIANGSSGVISFNADAKMIIESSSNSVLNMTSPTTSYQGIAFGDVLNTSRGGIYYTNSSYSGTMATNALSFFTNSLNRLTINSSGNVGIGTTSPDEILHVDNGTIAQQIKIGDGHASTLFVGCYEPGNVAGLSINRSITTGVFEDVSSYHGYISLTSGTTGSKIGLSTTTSANTFSTERVTIKEDGKIGVGVTTPQSKMDIEGNLCVGSTFSGTTGAPSNGALIEGLTVIGSNEGIIQGYEKLRIRTDGLTWDGAASFGSIAADAAVIIGEIAGYATIGGHTTSLTGWAHLNISPGAGTMIGGVGTPASRLSVAGNCTIGSSYAGPNAAPANGLIVEGSVGIGTATPGITYKLDVNGAGNFTSVYIGGVAHADYVFDYHYDGYISEEYKKEIGDYTMMPFNDEIAFTKEHRHLSTFESAEHYKKQGNYDIMDFSMKLLQTTETHFIYMKEMKDEIRNVQRDVDDMRKDVDDIRDDIFDMRKDFNDGIQKLEKILEKILISQQ